MASGALYLTLIAGRSVTSSKTTEKPAFARTSAQAWQHPQFGSPVDGDPASRFRRPAHYDCGPCDCAAWKSLPVHLFSPSSDLENGLFCRPVLLNYSAALQSARLLVVFASFAFRRGWQSPSLGQSVDRREHDLYRSRNASCAKFELTAFDGEATFAPVAKQEEKRWKNQTVGAIWQTRRKTAVGSWSRSARPNRARRKLILLLVEWRSVWGEGWRASDSSPGQIIEYAEPELKCWMPMPAANLSRASMPSPWEGDDNQHLDEVRNLKLAPNNNGSG